MPDSTKPEKPKVVPEKPVKPAKPVQDHKFHIHIEIEKKEDPKNIFRLNADVDNQLDMYEINRVYGHLMPRKKFLGLF